MAALLGAYIMVRDGHQRGQAYATWHGWSMEALEGWVTYMRQGHQPTHPYVVLIREFWLPWAACLPPAAGCSPPHLCWLPLQVCPAQRCHGLCRVVDV